MKTIYIASEYFGPANEIGAIRFTKVAKYLSRKGYHIVVFTRYTKNTIVDSILQDDVDELLDSGGKIFTVNSETNRMFDHFMAVSGFLHEELKYIEKGIYCGKKFARKHMTILKHEKLPQPDVLITTYGDWGGHYLGMKLKKKYGENLLWIADFRDPMKGLFATNTCIYRSIEWVRYHYKRRVVRASDVITIVSDDIRDDLHASGKESKIHIIKNGFDREDAIKRDLDFENNLTKEKFRIVYTGTIYSGLKKKYDLSFFFQALLELISEGKVNAEDLIVCYAGRHFVEFSKQLGHNEYNIEIVDYGFIPRTKSLALQTVANILLLASWNTKEDVGHIPAKIFEYFLVNKPIIAIVCGNKDASVAKRMLEEAGCGIAFEEASMDKDFQTMKSYFFELYTKWKNDSKFDLDSNKAYIAQFESNNIANAFESIFANCVNEKKISNARGLFKRVNKMRLG